MPDLPHLPATYAAEVEHLLQAAIPDAGDELLRRCLRNATACWHEGMSPGIFRLQARAAVLACAQKHLAAQHHSDQDFLLQHVRDTLRRCLPFCVTEELIQHCAEAVSGSDDTGDPMHTGAIYDFAAQYLKTPMASAPPEWQRLHQAALRRLPENRRATRDDLRLAALDALYDPAILPHCPHAGYFRLRLGLHGSPACSCEEISCLLHIPLTRVYEIEAAALQALAQYRRNPDA